MFECEDYGFFLGRVKPNLPIYLTFIPSSCHGEWPFRLNWHIQRHGRLQHSHRSDVSIGTTKTKSSISRAARGADKEKIGTLTSSVLEPFFAP